MHFDSYDLSRALRPFIGLAYETENQPICLTGEEAPFIDNDLIV